jgi:hypothetical protein
MPKQGITTCRALFDIIYLSQYPSHDEDTLCKLQDALDSWLAHRDYFIKVGVRDGFNIPKFHVLLHYIPSIRRLGSTKTYNTETFERLHIDYAKKAWRASNRRDALPQMTAWLARQERVEQMSQFIDWARDFTQHTSTSQATLAAAVPPRALFPKHPSVRCQPLTSISKALQLPHLVTHLKIFLHAVEEPIRPSRMRPEDQPLLFSGLDIYHGFKLLREGLDDDDARHEIIKATPHGTGRFDTVVVMTSNQAESVGLKGMPLSPQTYFC